jgi:hypothetical protein
MLIRLRNNDEGLFFGDIPPKKRHLLKTSDVIRVRVCDKKISDVGNGKSYPKERLRRFCAAIDQEVIIPFYDKQIGLVEPFCKSAPHPQKKEIEPAVICERYLFPALQRLHYHNDVTSPLFFYTMRTAACVRRKASLAEKVLIQYETEHTRGKALF